MTIDRQCSSGLMAIATAPRRSSVDGVDVDGRRRPASRSAWCRTSTAIASARTIPRSCRASSDVYMPMIDTAESGREALRHLARGAGRVRAGEPAAHRGGASRAAASTTSWRRSATKNGDRRQDQTKEVSVQGRDAVAGRRQPRPDTTLEGLAGAEAGAWRRLHHHRRQRQPAVGRRQRLRADERQACAERRGPEPLGVYRGIAVAGCEPDEMGIGPVFAVPRLLEAPRPQGGRHRSVGAQRGVRRAGALLPRQARAFRTSSTSTAARSRSAIPTA